MFCVSVRILFVWYFMNIMVSLVNASITHSVLLQVPKDVYKSRFVLNVLSVINDI